jgi:ech hydrogenase subunit D
MPSTQTFDLIPIDALLEKVNAIREAGHRLVQISATRLAEDLELTYSFDLEGHLTNLRLRIPAQEAHVPSVSSIYGCAFLYENEMHDLFDLKVDGMTVDFHGNFYQTAVKFPFGSIKAPLVKPAVPPASAAAPPAPAPPSSTAPVPVPVAPGPKPPMTLAKS